MKRIDTILFDWDGTLMDSAQEAFRAMNGAFRDLGVQLERAAYEKVYSPNWYKMYEALNLPKEKWLIADELWIRHYEKGASCLVPGGYDTVWELFRRGYDLGIVSSGSKVRVKSELSAFDLAQAFRIVLCNEDTLNKKPHPEVLETAMSRMNKTRDVCSYVGDSPEDVEMGKHAKVLTAGIRSGYPSRKRILSANPDLYLESIVELLDFFKDRPKENLNPPICKPQE